MQRFVMPVGSALGVLVAVVARANPVPLPFTYVYETLPKGEGEIEQYGDVTPIRALDAEKNAVTYAAMQYQTELEYGLTDRLELGLYVTLLPTPAEYSETADLTEGTGLKERLRYRLFDEGVLPVDVAFYGEVVEFQTELELEYKVILQKRFGDLRVVANLWGETELEYAGSAPSWVANPTLGATYQLSPMVHLGVEGWMRGEWSKEAPSPRPFALGPHEYVGPTMMLDFGRLWWSTGAYVRADDLDRTPQVGDNYGAVWIRSVIGVGL